MKKIKLVILGGRKFELSLLISEHFFNTYGKENGKFEIF